MCDIMRDIKRIKPIMQKIEAIWDANPDLRLGQLIGNVVDPKYLYEISDERLINFIEKTYPIRTNEPKVERCHKGEFCIYDKGVYCQEGFCSRCEIKLAFICI